MTKLARLLVGSIVLLAAGAALPAPREAWAAPTAPGLAPKPGLAAPAPTPFRDPERSALVLSTLARFARQAPNRTPFELRFEAALAQHPGARAAALRVVESYEHMTVDQRRVLLGNHQDATTRVFTDAQAVSLARGPVLATGASAGSAHPLGAKPPVVVINYTGLSCAKTYLPADAAFGVVYVFRDSPTQATVTQFRVPGGTQKIANVTPGSFSSVGATNVYTGPSDAGALIFDVLMLDPTPTPNDVSAAYSVMDEIVQFGIAHVAGAFPPGTPHTGADTLDSLAAGVQWFTEIWKHSLDVTNRSELLGAVHLTRIQSAELQAAATAPEQSAGPLHYKLASKHSEYSSDYSMYFDVNVLQTAVAPPAAAKPAH